MNNVIDMARGPLSASERAVLAAIPATGAITSSLAGRTGLPSGEITAALSQLRRRALITYHTTGFVRRAPARASLRLIRGDGPTVGEGSEPLPAA